MRSSKYIVAAVTLVLVNVWSTHAGAQQPAQGFDLERLYTSAPGAGWLVMDSLDMHGSLGGAASLVMSYAKNPLVVTDGRARIPVVSDEAFMQFGFAATYDRFRMYLTLDSPLMLQGNSGAVGGYTFTAPSVDPSSSPDAISHGRAGFDVRILGGPSAPFRLGLGAQLWFPGGAPGALRANYLSDGPPSGAFGAYNATFRVLFAGDLGVFTYAGQLGAHCRGLDDTPTPGSPQGSEAVFGAAIGGRIGICAGCAMQLVVGPEVFGATALKSAFGTNTTALEGIISARVEGTRDHGAQLRLRLGAGGGIDARFGAPAARIVVGIEMFDRGAR